MAEENEFHVVGASEGILRTPCGAPAPMAVNGAPYLGCGMAKGHSGRHTIQVAWDEGMIVLSGDQAQTP